MDSNALHLKPYVTLDQEGAVGVTPPMNSEDQAIRPYFNQQSGAIRQEECRHLSQNVGESVGHDGTSLGESNETLASGNVDDEENSTSSAYQIVALKIKWNSLSFSVVLVGDEIFCEQTESCASMNENITEKETERDVEKWWEADIPQNVDSVSADSRKFKVKSVAKNLNSSKSIAHFMPYARQGMLGIAESQKKLSKSIAEVYEKLQRRKKLCGVFETFSTFPYIDRPNTAVVFPVSRQNMSQGQRSVEQPSQQPQRQGPPDSVSGIPWEDLRREIYRLCTFADLPPNFPVFAIPLARAGFLRLPGGAIVCFFCGVQQDLWSWGDSPEEVHKRLNPTCSVFTGVDCSNVPLAVLQDASQLTPMMEAWSLSLSEHSLFGNGAEPPRQNGQTEEAASSLGVSTESLSRPSGSAQSNSTTSSESALTGAGMSAATGPGQFASRTTSGSLPSQSVAVSGQHHGETNTQIRSVETNTQAQSSAEANTQIRSVETNTQTESTAETNTQSSAESETNTQRSAETNTQSSAETNTQSHAGSETNTQSIRGEANSQANRHQPLSATLASTSTSAEGSRSTSSADALLSENATVRSGTAQPEAPGSGGQPSPSSSEAPVVHRVVTYQELGIVTGAPKHPNMASLDARLRSFDPWPPTHAQTPEIMAQAGFYYAGYGDCGRCFQCGGGLKNWEPADDPWTEHARWFARCDFLRLCRGQDFIAVVAHLNGRGDGDFTLDDVREEMRNRQAAGLLALEPAEDPAITAAMNEGLSRQTVDLAAQRLQDDGHPLTVDRLVAYLEDEGAFVDHGIEENSPFDFEAFDPNEARELSVENVELRLGRQCKVCLDREACLLFLPCGHLVCCLACAPSLTLCPMCRQEIKGRARAFPSWERDCPV